MKVKEFEKIIKEHKPENIIEMHMQSEIYLTDKQLDTVLEQRGEKKYMKTKTQKDRVLKYMRDFGSITSLEAIKEFGYTRLSDAIYRLKNIDCIDISWIWEKGKNRYGEKTEWKRYFIKGSKFEKELKERGF